MSLNIEAVTYTCDKPMCEHTYDWEGDFSLEQVTQGCPTGWTRKMDKEGVLKLYCPRCAAMMGMEPTPKTAVTTDPRTELIRLMALEIVEFEEMKRLLIELFGSDSIGTFGVRNSNGADTYCCPGCGVSVETKGYCGFTSDFNLVKHQDTCGLLALHKMVFKDTEEEEVSP